MTSSTRNRLVDAAKKLFAAKGFSATSIGDIEETAGFTRRGGTFYKHFTSKDEVLTAIIEDQIPQEHDAKLLHELLPLADRRSELLLLGRVLLAELDREEAIHRILEKDGERVDRARQAMAERVLHHGYRELLNLFRGWTDTGDGTDFEATVVVLLGGLVNLRRNRWTFGAVPLEVDDERALDAWLTIAEATLGPEPRR